MKRRDGGRPNIVRTRNTVYIVAGPIEVQIKLKRRRIIVGFGSRWLNGRQGWLAYFAHNHNRGRKVLWRLHMIPKQIGPFYGTTMYSDGRSPTSNTP